MHFRVRWQLESSTIEDNDPKTFVSSFTSLGLRTVVAVKRASMLDVQTDRAERILAESSQLVASQ